MQNRIGPFEIAGEIGRGGMGVVYLARDERLGRDVAIKAAPPELAGDPARLERFEREAKMLAQLNHPNIAGIYGVEEQDGGALAAPGRSSLQMGADLEAGGERLIIVLGMGDVSVAIVENWRGGDGK